ncbi:lipolytic protein G-D-S-L family [Hymenobacter roseosalivarius DSM 11622]|uniref:Lipolytic protein G-D-S-L family n=1 Tax=Hymenobacter roseosalivarius DSM 11622 TaxID=645990 RepID=A0A1W1UJW1_9BACT|nr:SGNH/GDSL hydrolase family protein [Hymenobacter roseosalivarius]SMB81370.1 lipolytic protein G-D-S-L family [Hymenobacter roseosalivarius DSM 11622]
MRATHAFRRFRFFLFLAFLPAIWAVVCSRSPAPVTIMPLGDSITQGNRTYPSYRRPLWRTLQHGQYEVNFVGSRMLNKGGLAPHLDFDLDHQGQWGWTTAMLLPEIRQWSLDHQPDMVLLHAGTNDCFGPQPVEAIRDNLGRIIDQLRGGNPRVKVLLAQLIPSAPPFAELNAKITALNALLPALARAKTTDQSPVVIVDQNTGFSREAGVDLHDGLHPNDQGQAKMAARWYQALQAPGLLGKQPPAPRASVVGDGSPLAGGSCTTCQRGANALALASRKSGGSQLLPIRSEKGGVRGPSPVR